MAENRLPLVCYNELMRLDKLGSQQHNWTSQLRKSLSDLGYENLWLEQKVELLKDNYKNVLDHASNIEFYTDLSRVENSS